MAEIGKPGINHLQVTPENKAKLVGLMKHYAKFPHPFTKCVQDNRKRFGPNAEKVCAVLKDLIKGTTKWRGEGKSMALAEFREVVDLADARGLDCDSLHELRAIVEFAERHDSDTIDFARGPGLVQAEIQVKSKSGKMFTRKIWVRPKQAKALKKQGGKLSQQGVKVTREQTAVLNELAKIPKEQRPKGWQALVKALVDPRHGGRLGPQKRKLLHDVAKKSPANSPLRQAAASALTADVPKGRKAKGPKGKSGKVERTKRGPIVVG